MKQFLDPIVRYFPLITGIIVLIVFLVKIDTTVDFTREKVTEIAQQLIPLNNRIEVMEEKVSYLEGIENQQH